MESILKRIKFALYFIVNRNAAIQSITDEYTGFINKCMSTFVSNIGNTIVRISVKYSNNPEKYKPFVDSVIVLIAAVKNTWAELQKIKPELSEEFAVFSKDLAESSKASTEQYNAAIETFGKLIKEEGTKFGIFTTAEVIQFPTADTPVVH